MPKFKVGDVVRDPGNDDSLSLTYEILRVDNDCYIVKTLHDGKEWFWNHSSCDDDQLDSAYRATKQFDQDLNNLLEE
jgi:hypothetical protein